MSSPPCPSREAVDASEDAKDDTEPGGMNGEVTGDGDDDVKNEGPVAEVDDDADGGGDDACPDTDMR
ncbi:hypothetical protein ElyMa_005694100 [Elysia marginata]|uniref:Uncharacterized protein n=1 Tax=Elysia marginata TaxID=1093978 RepID=A0AAV4FH16_9GAST|nr:hypothetical protein ElyMa_005694100 [Elysia marginata]